MRRAQQNSTGRRRIAPAALGIGLAALLAVAACGSGQIAQTAGMPPAVDGGSGEIGKMNVRNASVAFPATGRAYPIGGEAPLVVTIVNSGDLPDTLVSVTSPVATGAAALSGTTDIPGGSALVAGKDLVDATSAAAAETTSSLPETTASGSATTTTGSAATGSSASSEPAAGSTTTTTPTATGQPAAIGQVSIVLKGLTAVVQPGQSIPVTFTFAKAGTVTLQVPMAAPGGTPTAEPTATTPNE